jgi:energy-coupling factor transporter transmembrane protein EcfT
MQINNKTVFVVGIILSCIMFIFVIGVTSHIGNKSVFVNSLVTSLIISLFYFIVLIKIKIYNSFEKKIISSICFLFLMNLSVFGPVFIDRSISYYITMNAVEKKNFSARQLHLKTSKQVYEKRLVELCSLGLIQKLNMDTYEKTRLGDVFFVFFHTLGKLTGTLREYENFSRNANQIN